MRKRKKEGVRQNLNYLGEAILSEAEAKKRLHIYLEDLKKPDIDYVSIKVSAIYSQINLLAFDETVDHIVERLKELYRSAMNHPEPKFVNLDMEEYRDLDLTVAAFKKLWMTLNFTHFLPELFFKPICPIHMSGTVSI